MLSLIIQKFKTLRMPIPSLIMLALASYRSITSGESILIVGICAAVVPFICQFKNFPRVEDASALLDVISSYVMNLILMVGYMAFMLILAWLGKTFNPGYVVNPHFWDMVLISLCADLVFVSAVIPVCRDLNPMQRMIPALVLTNGLVAFLIMASGWVKTANLTSLPLIVCGFCALILVLTFSMIYAGYGARKKK